MRAKIYILAALALLTASVSAYALDSVAVAQDAVEATIDSVAAETSEAEASESAESESFDAKEVIFSHIGDAYEYHITEINGHPISVPLLVIVRSEERGWFAFCSNRVTHGDTYKGFFIQKGGDYDGKIVETNSKGEIVRPFDMSITRNVFALLLSSCILILIFVPMAHKYKKNPLDAHSKGHNMIEAVILYIEDDVIKPALGDKYLKYSPYLLTVFFFILLNNLMGLVPIFPMGANLTGNISITFVLAMFTYLITNIFGTREYWKEVLWPEVPLFLKAPIPLMPVIEIISTITKPIALMIRLFANIFAGHMIILVLICLIFIFSSIMGVAVGAGVSVVSILFSVFMYCLELLVAFIQAYVFTMLSAIFIGLAQVEHHKS